MAAANALLSRRYSFSISIKNAPSNVYALVTSSFTGVLLPHSLLRKDLHRSAVTPAPKLSTFFPAVADATASPPGRTQGTASIFLTRSLSHFLAHFLAHFWVYFRSYQDPPPPPPNPPPENPPPDEPDDEVVEKFWLTPKEKSELSDEARTAAV